MRLGLSASSPAHVHVDDFRSLRDLYTPRQVAGMLQRERARADRHGREFALVVIRLRDEPGEWSLLRVARMVLDAARTTDEVGRYDDDAVCAILPDTDAAGAWYFARRVCAIARTKGLDPICMVYAYPSAWNPGDEEGGQGFRARQRHRHQDQSPGSTGGGRGHAPPRHPQLHLHRDEDDLPSEGTSRQSGISLNPLSFHRPTPWWKRSIDFTGAAIGLTVLAPVLIVIAAAIKLTDPDGPVIFRQRRAGLAGRPFMIYKFRTMYADAEARKAELMALNEQDGPAFKIEHDPRVTPLGRVLRKTSLDELPQLLNVLRGDMSLVGPRPLPVGESDACDPWHRRRLDVAPGLTCIWQVHGRSRVSFDEWARMDIRYIRRRKLWHDMSILLQTIPAVLLRRGAK
jgi:lipopolysaccharide/colanic/teichoic acid biosynthesis glycosyltransferase